MRIAVMTVSTAVSRREADDECGPRVAELAEHAGFQVHAMEVVPDDFALIEDRLFNYVDEDIELIVALGGIGIGPADVTPQALRAVIEYELPGIGEALRAGIFGRELGGVIGRTLIVALPDEVGAAERCFGLLEPHLAEAISTLRGARARD
jgi:molybdenum cofactor synthesis domain-containing protein